jgi:hypothetical protein
MADPILTDIWKCQATFKGFSGLPEDQFVNNFYFRDDPGLVEDPVGAIKRVMDAFYNTPAPGTNRAISSFFASGVVGLPEYRIYDLGEPPPRTRRTEIGSALAAHSGTLPWEVALCMSYFAGTNTPRRRGRVFIGPLTNAAVSETLGRPGVNSVLLDTVADRASAMGRTTENVTWVMVTEGGTKPPLEAPNARVVTAGWVDDAWDTQRRRGLDASTRKTFSAV